MSATTAVSYSATWTGAQDNASAILTFPTNNNYTLNCSGAAVTVTTVAANFTRVLSIALGTANVTVTGMSAAIFRGRRLALGTAAVTVSAIDTIFADIPGSPTMRRAAKFVLQKLRINQPTLED